MLIKKKTCNTCGETKSLKEFYGHKDTKDGYQYKCKACLKSYNQTAQRKQVKKEYRKSDRGKQSDRRYIQTEKGRKAKKRYDQSRKGRRAAKRHRQTDKFKQSVKRFLESDKGKQYAKRKGAIRKTNETQAGGSYTTDEWHTLCKFYEFHCLKCDKEFPFTQLTLDHVKPVSKGGSSFIWNVQPLCRRCNSSKGNKEIDYRKTLPDWINRDGPVWQQDTLF